MGRRVLLPFGSRFSRWFFRRIAGEISQWEPAMSVIYFVPTTE
jgi:hypothetical protein